MGEADSAATLGTGSVLRSAPLLNALLAPS
jgi:hypothetical protein